MVFSGTSPDGRLIEMVEIPEKISLLHVNSIQNFYLDQIDHNPF